MFVAAYDPRINPTREKRTGTVLITNEFGSKQVTPVSTELLFRITY